jgi:hypothetical protein
MSEREELKMFDTATQKSKSSDDSAKAIEKLANILSIASGRTIVPVTEKVKQQMGNRLVVFSEDGKTLLVNGAHHIGHVNGEELPTEVFNSLIPTGVICLFNPEFQYDGTLKLK